MCSKDVVKVVKQLYIALLFAVYNLTRILAENQFVSRLI